VDLSVIALSAIFQITAVLFAFRLIGVACGRTAWVPLAAALCLVDRRSAESGPAAPDGQFACNDSATLVLKR